MKSIQLRYATDDDRKAWNEFVFNQEASTYSHIYEWREIIGSTYGLKSKYLIFYIQTEIVGVLPLILTPAILGKSSWLSIPFTNYGGLLMKDEIDRNDFINIIKEFISEENKIISIRQLKCNREEQSNIVTSRLSLTRNDKLWMGFKSKVRNQVRKAIKSELRLSSDINHLNVFYNKVYIKSMHRLGTPHHSKNFFHKLINIFPNDKGLLTIWYKNQLIAGMLYLVVNGIFFDFVANSLYEYNSFCPNNLLYWEAMNKGIELGCKEFDFGRSTYGTGVFKFKQQWGSTVYPIYNLIITQNGENLSHTNIFGNSIYGLSSFLWPRIPFYLVKSLGPSVRRYLP